ncbi:YqaA family protein [Thalassospira permensis]|uniref:Membrane protein n=1 Tax=Thalassospira permensis NBRC 106175 TaxID=1353532 RepID=A0ABR4TL56_9PROT|nr:VTT domain-containing protein [Thalassospira permensis]KEO53421.1 membrane protein [Thalassospira permensis NBRC 106175]
MEKEDKNRNRNGLAGWWRVWQQRLEKLAAGRKGLGGIAVASFLETTIIPIPIEILIAPIMAASRRRGVIVATVTLLGSVAGAVFLYLIAYGLSGELIQPIIETAGGQQEFQKVEQQFEEGGFWVVFAISIAPIPMQLAALAAGATTYPFWLFLVAIGISRALRYYGLWLLVLGFGVGIARLFEGKKPDRLEKPEKGDSV